MAEPEVDIKSLIEQNNKHEWDNWVYYRLPTGKQTLVDIQNMLTEPHESEARALIRDVLTWAQMHMATLGRGNLTAKEQKAQLRDAMSNSANKDQLLVSYLAIGKQLSLPGHLLHFKDDYSPKWNAEEVYGRMDPIVTYQGTPRKVTIGWEVDAPKNIGAFIAGAIGDFVKFLYPVYQDNSTQSLGANTMTSAPLLRMSMVTAAPEDKKATVSFLGGSTGFLIAVDQFDIEKYTAGAGSSLDIVRLPAGGILPIKYTLTIGGYVFHEDAKPGWVWTNSDDGTAVSFGTNMGSSYPYGQRGTTTTYRVAQQATGTGNPGLIQGAGAAAAAASRTQMITEPDPGGFLGEDAGGPVSSTEDDAPYPQE